jgi:CDP-4-dehydro-6-deoxyglucose reductase
VSRIDQLSPGLALLQLKTPRSKTLRFMAGQGVELSDDAGNHARYSLASCPCDGRNLQFFVERRDGDAFSRRVFDGTLAAQSVQVNGPEGTFVLQDDSTAPAVFVAIDNGFSPVRSLVEHAISIDHQESLNLFVSGWPERVPHIHNLCRAWRDALDHFHYRSVPEDATPEAIIAQLEREAPELSGSEIYIAGPVEKAQAVADGLRRLDALPADQLRLLVTDGGAAPA